MVNSTEVRRDRHAAPAADGIDPRAFREALGGFASGVVVVSGMSDGEPMGLTCQAFTSLSIDPPLVAFCANVLADGQREVSDLFGRRRDDKFQQVSWRPGLTGMPLIEGAAVHIECEIEDVHPGGDHEVVIGRVVALASDAARGPLLYHRGRYATLAVPRV